MGFISAFKGLMRGTSISQVSIGIFRRLRDGVRIKRHEKWGFNKLVIPSRQCSSTPVPCVKNLLPKDNMTTAQNPTFPSGQAAADFYLHPRLKSALKGGRSCDPTAIIKNVTEELKRLSQNVFQESFLTTLQSLAEVYSCTILQEM
jgi:hypothetical protein